MKQDQFTNLRGCLQFDKSGTRNEMCFEERFASLQNIMEMLSIKCRSNYNSSPYLTVDEQLVTFRGHCPFEKFIPSKPEK